MWVNTGHVSPTPHTGWRTPARRSACLDGKRAAPLIQASRPRCHGGSSIATGAPSLTDIHEGAPDVSVVVPVYGNRDTASALHDELRGILDASNLTYEIVFIN